MESAPVLSIPPTPFPPPPNPTSSFDLSPLEFVLALVAIVTIPALVYTFFFTLNCPPNPFGRRPRSHHSGSISGDSEASHDATSDFKYQKDAHIKEIGSECPVCLSVFSDGEDIKQLNTCKHSFHASCIDMWLNNHSNCPICRASVEIKRPNSSYNNNNNRSASVRDGDLHQGLPDSSSLV